MQELEQIMFTEAVQKIPLPQSLIDDPQRLERFKVAILSAVESLYFDRIKPSLGEVRERLRGKTWQAVELRALLTVCANDPVRFILMPPPPFQPPCAMLRSCPPWFEGWTAESADVPVKAQSNENDSRKEAPQLSSQTPSTSALQTLASVIEGLYRERLRPTLAEVHRALFILGWSWMDVQKSTLVLADATNMFRLTKPSEGKPVEVLLKNTPSWFLGWPDDQGNPLVPLPSKEAETYVKCLMASGVVSCLGDDEVKAAEVLRSYSQAPLTLGELRFLVRKFLELGYLSYDDPTIVVTKVLIDEFSGAPSSFHSPSTLITSPGLKMEKRRIYSSI